MVKDGHATMPRTFRFGDQADIRLPLPGSLVRMTQPRPRPPNEQMPAAMKEKIEQVEPKSNGPEPEPEPEPQPEPEPEPDHFAHLPSYLIVLPYEPTTHAPLLSQKQKINRRKQERKRKRRLQARQQRRQTTD